MDKKEEDGRGQGAVHRPKMTLEDYYDTPVRKFPRASRVLYRVALAVVYAFSKLYWRWTCDGPNPFRGRSPKGAEPMPGRVIVANHASMFDPVVLMLAASRGGRALRPLYKSELDKAGFVSWFFSRVGAMPIRRDTADMKAIKRAVKAIRAGEDICIFPEGTRIKDPLARPKLHGGFSMVAQLAGCDVVPIAIDGSEAIVPSGKGFSRPAKVRLRFGDPVSFAEVPGESRREKADGMEALAMSRVYEMRAALRAEHGKPAGLPGSAPEVTR